MTLLSQAEYGRRIGVSRASISQWKKAGRLVLQGDQVDVEASDAKLKRYRRAGLPDITSQTEFVKHGLPDVKGSPPLNTNPVCLTCAEIVRRLKKLDDTQIFDWSDEAMKERAKRAATCIGWIAETSNIRDDGHHGGFQLRIAINGTVAAGYGFELSACEVLHECREELDPIDGEDEYSVHLDLLHLLARPFHEYDTRK
jgi:hypothetical protein